MTEPTPAPAPQPAPQPAGPLSAEDDALYAKLSHILGILGILPSLIIFLVFKDRGARTRVESKEALNWQITALGAYVALWIVVGIISAILTGVAVASNSYATASALLGLTSLLALLPGVIWIANVVFSIIGFVKVNQGGSYRYPVAIRLVK